MNCSKPFAASIILCALLSGVLSISYCQPTTEFIRAFHSSGDEAFNDIYAVSDSGFIMCGYTRDTLDNWNSFVVRTDKNGDEIWSRVYNSSTYAKSVIETDDGNFLFGCHNRGEDDSQFHAMMIDEGGNIIWQRNYDVGGCEAVIELKNDNFLLGGWGDGEGRLILINDEGDPMWSHYYDIDRGKRIYALRETDGGAVAAGIGGRPDHFWALKVDLEDGEPIWSQLYDDVDGFKCYSMVSDEDGGFALG